MSPKNTKTKNTSIVKPKKGFTLIEVTLVLAIAGMMLIGLISSSFSTIARQRYNDSVRGYAEFLRSMYNEVINPESLGNAQNPGDDLVVGNSTTQAILGKILVFGLNDDYSTVYTATLLGNSDINRGTGRTFLEEITDTSIDGTNTSIFCGDRDEDPRPSSVSSYKLLWEAHLQEANDAALDTHFTDPFVGTMIIARTPTSATVHTAFAKDVVFDLAENCRGENNNANEEFREALNRQHENIEKGRHSDEDFDIYNHTSMCVVSDNSSVYREVQVAADGRNTSAIWVRPTDDGENKCERE